MPRCTDSQIAQSWRLTMSQKSPASDGSNDADSTSVAANSKRQSIAVRATASGFAAATAKAGATLGIFVLPEVRAYWGVPGVLALMAAVSALGVATTALLARNVRKIPEGLGLEDAAGLR